MGADKEVYHTLIKQRGSTKSRDPRRRNSW